MDDMKRLRKEAASYEEGQRLLAILEKQEEHSASALADVFAAVLEEARQKSGKSLSNGEQRRVDLFDAVGRIPSMLWMENRTQCDVVVLKEGLALEGDFFPFSGIECIATADVPLMGALPGNGKTDPEIAAAAESAGTEGYVFVRWQRNTLPDRHPSAHSTLTLKSRESVSLEVDRAVSSKPLDGNRADVLGRLLHLLGLSVELFDRVTHCRPQNGASYFTAVLNDHAGFLFLMEQSVCFGGETAVNLSIGDILAVAYRGTKAAHFTLELHTKGNPRLRAFCCLPNEEKSTIMDFFKEKNIPVSKDQDLMALYVALQTCSAQDIEAIHRDLFREKAELRPAPEKAADRVVRPSERPQLGRSSSPSKRRERPRADEEADDPAIEALMQLWDSKDFSDDEDRSSESTSDGTASPETTDFAALLVGEDLPDQDEEDSDYTPADPANARTKRKRDLLSSTDGKEWLIRKRCLTDDDIELEEIDSE